MPRRVLGVAIGQVAAARGIAACVRELGRPADTAVVVLSSRVHVGWATVLAPLDARWTIHAHRRPPSEVRTMAVMVRVGQRLARWRARHRRARGGRVNFLCGNAAFAEEWGHRHPWLEPEVVHLSGVVDLVPAPKDEARAALGLEPSELIGLQFGADHGGKDLATIFLAFAGADAPAHLVGAGNRVDVKFDEVRRSHPDVEFPKVTVLGGAQSDEIRHLLHSAADFAVLSFKPDRTSDSGTLTDAASYGLAVCCSDRSLAGALVDEYALGLTYRAGDPDSLRDTVARVGCFNVDASDATRFREDQSMVSIARRMLASAKGDG